MRSPYSITTNRLRSNRATPPDARPGPPVERRVSLVALEEEIQIPDHRGLVGRRRVRVLRIEQAALPLDSFVATRQRLPSPKLPSNQIEAATRRVLPPRQPEPAELECRLEGRPVRLRSIGQVMADEAGKFYEVSGGQLRPLGELVSDEQGRIFEVRPTSESRAGESATQQVEPNGRPGDRAPVDVASKTEAANHSKTPSRPAPAPAAPDETSPGYRKILADPGLYLKLPWSNIKGEMTRQVKHPERLSDADEVECYAQIYEAQRTLAAADLASVELGDGALHADLHPLTLGKARMLGTPQLFKPASHPFETRASTRQIHAGQRVYRLWPLFDPSAERPAKPGRESAASSKKDVVLRMEVPREYLNTTQFRHSREEVLYDMKGMLGTLPPEARALARWFLIYPLRVVKALATATFTRRRLKKWRAMLNGKDPDRQLWAVTPPRGFSHNPAVRSWAEQTLGNAGYDAQRMLPEWEIFWRRTGIA